MRRIGNTITAVLLVLCGALAAKATPAVPRLVRFTGALNDAAGQPLTGVVGLTFSLYAQPEGGAPLWMETQNVQADPNGNYSVLLGSTRNDGIPAEAFASGPRWLGIQQQGEPERPRVLLSSVPYSLKAADAETLGGLPASAYALAATANSGAPRADVAESPAALAKPLHPAAAAAPDQTGSGTTNFITIWTAATTLGNSKLYQTTAGNVGLGTTAPTAKFEAISATATGTGILGDASSATGANFGVTGKTASTTGTGVFGSASAATGVNYGVYGSTISPNGISVYGAATNGTGVEGVTAAPAAFGVYGNNTAVTGNAIGVYGSSASPDGYAVYGANTATTGHAFGVYGTNASTSGTGLLGANTAATGATFGVYGSVVSPNGIAVQGAATTGTGVVGTTTSPTGYGVYGGNAATTGGAVGVAGVTASTVGVGVQGISSAATGTNYGVYGSSVSPTAVSVYGTATIGTGVAGGSSGPSGYGVYGANVATSGNAIGVYGNSSSPAGIGVSANATAGGTALLAIASGGGLAGQFTGNVKVTGNLTVSGTVSKGGGSFRIDHPLDPEHKYLYHSFVESPDMMNIYNGVATLSKHGDAVVQLPDWFDALNRDFRYQLTCIGGFAPVYVAAEVSGNQFKIGGGRPGMRVSWQVTGIRQDAFANQHRIPVEEDKPPVE